jgi:hypothetical protein
MVSVLYLDAPIGPIDGLMVFSDHADKDLFYYINDRPRLARNDGVPEFVFLKYKRDITDNPTLSPEDKEHIGGGFLAFTVDLSVDEQVLKAVRGKLAAFAGGTPKLTPVQFRKGSVRLSITKDVAGQEDAPVGTTPGTTFFEQVYGSTKPSLVGDNRATFGVILDHEGATLMEAALRSGISPIGVIYDLEYLGLRPAFDVKIHADYKRIYSHLEVEFGLKASYGPISAAVDIGLAWQKLKDEGAIKVEVISFTDDADLRRQADAAFDWFKTELLRDFFKSSLEPPSFMRQGQGGLLSSLQSLLGPLTQTLQGSPVPALGTPTTAAPTVAPPPDGPNSGLPKTADTNRVAAAGAGAGATGGAGGAKPAGGLGLQIGFSLKKYEQEELKERNFEYSEQAAVARDAAPQGLFSTMVGGLDLRRAIKEINLNDDFFKRIDTTFTLAADLAREKIAAVNVNTEYPGERPAGTQPEQVGGYAFTVQNAGPKRFETFLNEHLDLRYRYKIAVDFGSDTEWEGDEPHFESDWIVSTAQSITVNPFEAVDRFDLEVVPGNDLSGSGVTQVQVELEYQDPATGFRAARTMTFAPGGVSQHWKLRFGETTQKVYRYRITYFLPDNVRVPTDWVTSSPITTESDSLVLHSPFQGLIELRVVPLLDPATILEADLDIVYREPATGYEKRQTLTLPGGSPLAGQTLRVPTLSATPVGLTTTATVVRTDGSVFQGQPTNVQANQRVLLLSDGVGSTHRIMVKLPIADLASTGLLAVRVRLAGPGPDGDRGEALFTAGDPGPHTVTLVQPGSGVFTYTYEVEGYTTVGLPRPGVNGTGSDTALILPLPA